MSPTVDVVVIGAGPAGLATSAALSRAGVTHHVLERGGDVGHTWANLYDSLVLHTAKGLSALPGLPFPKSTSRFPTRRDLLDYLHRYADRFRVPLTTRADVTSVRREDNNWVVGTATGAELRARAVVIATGIIANPHEPVIAHRDRFRGRVFHSVHYHRPESFTGRRLLVVGAGNSAGEISVELVRAGAHVTLAVRTGAVIVPRDIAGIPIQYFSVALGLLPASAQRIAMTMLAHASALVRGPAVLPAPPRTGCQKAPLVGLHLADALRARTIQLKGGIAEFTEAGMRFDDGSEAPFDVVILATGYRPALGALGSLIRIDPCGFAQRRDRVASSDQPALYFVGHNYGIQGGLFNIGRDARIVAGQITAA